MILADIKDYIETNSIVSCKVYIVRAPQLGAQSDSPYVVVNKVSHLPAHAFGGDTGYHTDRIQFTVVGKSYAEVIDIVRDLKKEFATYNESDSTVTMGSTWVQSTLIANEVSDWTVASESFFTVLDVMFNYVDNY